jgi:hypothetical protein
MQQLAKVQDSHDHFLEHHGTFLDLRFPNMNSGAAVTQNPPSSEINIIIFHTDLKIISTVPVFFWRWD